MKFSFAICPGAETLTDATTPVQGGPKNNNN